MDRTKGITPISEREQRIAGMISKMDDTTLFALECYLAGSRAGMLAAEQRQEQAEDKEAVMA